LSFIIIDEKDGEASEKEFETTFRRYTGDPWQ
jgi:hypothetical protein